MNIRSEYDRDMGNHYYGPQLAIKVPMPRDYTPEELKYAQEELVRLTYLSLYKVIDEIGARREDVAQRLRETGQEEAGQAKGPRQADTGDRTPHYGGSPWVPGTGPGYRREAEARAQAPSQEAQACPGCRVICRRCE